MISVSVCLSVCLHISKPHVQISHKFSVYVICGLAVARSSVDSAIRYVGLLPVLWMTSCFHIIAQMGQNRGFV